MSTFLQIFAGLALLGMGTYIGSEWEKYRNRILHAEIAKSLNRLGATLRQMAGYDIEFGTDESLYSRAVNPTYERWEEHELSKCEHGCKIYKNAVTDQLALAHNSAYGCKITAEVIACRTPSVV